MVFQIVSFDVLHDRLIPPLNVCLRNFQLGNFWNRVGLGKSLFKVRHRMLRKRNRISSQRQSAPLEAEIARRR